MSTAPRRQGLSVKLNITETITKHSVHKFLQKSKIFFVPLLNFLHCVTNRPRLKITPNSVSNFRIYFSRQTKNVSKEVPSSSKTVTTLSRAGLPDGYVFSYQ
jgi:hypothetical protein